MSLPYNKEDIRQARQTDIISYLQSVNEAARAEGRIEPYLLKPEGKEFRVEGYGGLIVNQNYWSVQSQKVMRGDKLVTKGGNTLDFLTQFEGKSFKEAMSILTGKELKNKTRETVNREYRPSDKSNFKVPEKFENSRRVIAYLTKTRKISPELVISEIRKGNIFEDRDHHNAVFIGRNPDKEPRWANKRSTLTDRSWKGDAEFSDPRYPYVMRNELNRNDGYLIATESAIEALSYATLLKIHGQQPKNDLMGIGGAHGVGIIQYLKDNPETRGVILALNNDRQGHESTKLIENELKAHGYLDRRDFTLKILHPKGHEDWNDLLKDVVHKKELERKQNEERGVIGEIKIPIKANEEPVPFQISKNKIVRNGSDNIVLYGKDIIATLNTSTMTFGISEKGVALKHTYFVKKTEIPDVMKREIIHAVDKSMERAMENPNTEKSVDATGRLSNQQLLAKNPKELSVEDAIRAYKLRQNVKNQTKKSSPDRAAVRERVKIR
ncbi:hypothetical protein A8L34_27980 [Bacillus sp. FJAT-27264]|uniref:DUF3991 and TOPRIM domain-containing protein n=1 Tax=Paenibacillus sp. (strain DSM 101736 / FJAT-27264) TaxID=1850362 RepID=UPI000807E1DE|nr:DUF3991 and TOPRIM domain-containing protein [Bacillus sp. FJAT-27264]OBZ15888.1 hypothetical protein A8L34_27980 [Bacillus sp. FJAT-27264]